MPTPEVLSGRKAERGLAFFQLAFLVISCFIFYFYLIRMSILAS